MSLYEPYQQEQVGLARPLRKPGRDRVLGRAQVRLLRESQQTLL
jgi:hypothetical protein